MDEQPGGRRLPPPTPSRYESVVDRAVREAQARGELDGLAGAGRPLPPHEPGAWVRRLVEREGLSAEPLLPPGIRLRKELDRLPATLAGLGTEAEVRAEVAALNRRVLAWLRTPSGPPVRLGPVDVEVVLDRWRGARAAAAPPSPVRPDPPPHPPRRRWWRRPRPGA